MMAAWMGNSLVLAAEIVVSIAIFEKGRFRVSVAARYDVAHLAVERGVLAKTSRA